MDIQHSEGDKKFFMLIGGEEAQLLYRKDGKTIDISRVFVPEAARGQGLAEQLALAAFAWAKKYGYSIVPTCPYIRDTFLKKHAELRILVAR